MTASFTPRRTAAKFFMAPARGSRSLARRGLVPFPSGAGSKVRGVPTQAFYLDLGSGFRIVGTDHTAIVGGRSGVPSQLPVRGLMASVRQALLLPVPLASP